MIVTAGDTTPSRASVTPPAREGRERCRRPLPVRHHFRASVTLRRLPGRPADASPTCYEGVRCKVRGPAKEPYPLRPLPLESREVVGRLCGRRVAEGIPSASPVEVHVRVP